MKSSEFSISSLCLELLKDVRGVHSENPLSFLVSSNVFRRNKNYVNDAKIHKKGKLRFHFQPGLSKF